MTARLSRQKGEIWENLEKEGARGQMTNHFSLNNLLVIIASLSSRTDSPLIVKITNPANS